MCADGPARVRNRGTASGTTVRLSRAGAEKGTEWEMTGNTGKTSNGGSEPLSAQPSAQRSGQRSAPSREQPGGQPRWNPQRPSGMPHWRYARAAAKGPEEGEAGKSEAEAGKSEGAGAGEGAAGRR
ncbi:hypothetical protein GCM10009863_25240 [Streptomyces axinellae]|uniref:Uncharacterized protein n=1 Tax=Streptomyces axinellae TaxID=552788 RepID=A0ABN3Q3K6_9ACTN